MLGRRGRYLFFCFAIVACGTLPTTDDGGVDASNDVVVNDASTLDNSVPDSGGADVVVTDVVADVPKDNYIAPPDAPYVALDAATAPWILNIGEGSIYDVAVDSNQNVLAGGWTGTTTYPNFFAEKIDATGALVWKKEVGSNSAVNHAVSVVTFDAAGNAYVAGYVGDAVDLGGGNIGPGYLVVKYDSSGTFQWQYGPFTNSVFTRLRTKSNGNLLIAGVINGSQNYGGGSLAPNGSSDALLVELTSSKSFVSATKWGGSGDQAITAMSVDFADRVFLAGNFDGTIDFGGGAMTASTNHDLFVSKLDSSGGYIAQIQLQAADTNSSVHGLSVDWAGNVFITIQAYGSVNLGGKTLTPLGPDDVVFGKLDPSLNHVFSKIFGDSYGQYPVNVAADPTGGAGFTGGYESTMNFGLGNLPTGSTSSDSIYVAQFAADGGPMANLGTGGTTPGYGFGMAFVTWPDFVIGGQCYGSLTLPGGTITCNSNGGAFVARLKP